MDLRKEVLGAEIIFDETVTILLEDRELMIHIPALALVEYFDLEETKSVETEVKEKWVAGTSVPDYQEEYQYFVADELVEQELTKEDIVEYLLNGGAFDIEDM